MADDIKQTVTLNARPTAVFEMLMDSRKHQSFTGAPAKISRKPGGAFSCYGGELTGVTLDTQTGKLIVQAWRAKGWPKGAWSIATFKLAGAPRGKTKLSFTQTGVPRSAMKGIAQGWKTYYWDAMKAHIKAAK